MTKEQLLKKLQGVEWDDFECKSAQSKVPANVWETVSSFSNTAGGWIVFGVNQAGKKFDVQGVSDVEHVESDFLNTLRSGQKFNCRIFPVARKFDINGLNVLAFFVQPSPDKPVYFGGTINNTFIRSGSGDRRATNEEIAAMFRDRMFGIKSEQFISGTSIEDINMATLHDYRSYLSSTQSKHTFESDSDSEFCYKIHVMDKDGTLNYAGLTMFGKRNSVLRYVPTFCVDYVEIPGDSLETAETRYSYRIPEQENIWDAFRIINRRLQTVVNIPFHLDSEGRNVGDMSQYEIIREALANFLMHSDQFNTVRSCIHVFLNRVEFINGGAMPVKVNEISGQCYTNPRNPSLARMFRLADVAENVGFWDS